MYLRLATRVAVVGEIESVRVSKSFFEIGIVTNIVFADMQQLYWFKNIFAHWLVASNFVKEFP